MVGRNEYEEARYQIPDNFIEGGRIFNGMFRTRYFIEGVILGFVGLFISQLPNYASMQSSIIVHILLIAPLFLIGLVGINDLPISIFLATCIKWKRKKAIYFYNGKPRSQRVRPVDKLMHSVTARDRMIAAIQHLRASKDAKDYNYVEGVDYVFREDLELEDRAKKAAKRNKKKSKNAKREAKAEEPATFTPTEQSFAPTVKANNNIPDIDGSDIFHE